MYCRNIYIVRLLSFCMDNLVKNEKEIAKKQKKLGKLNPEQQEVYKLVAIKIKAMPVKDRIKLLKKKSAVDKLIAEAREILSNG